MLVQNTSSWTIILFVRKSLLVPLLHDMFLLNHKLLISLPRLSPRMFFIASVASLVCCLHHPPAWGGLIRKYSRRNILAINCQLATVNQLSIVSPGGSILASYCQGKLLSSISPRLLLRISNPLTLGLNYASCFHWLLLEFSRIVTLLVCYIKVLQQRAPVCSCKASSWYIQ